MQDRSSGQARGLKALLAATPILGPVVRSLARSAPVEAVRRQLRFRGSSDYWERRYRAGGNSGAGSYGRLAEFKAEILNEFVAREGIVSIVEFGCGDGAQLALAQYPDYVGIDVAATSVALCRTRFAEDPGKQFFLAGEVPGDLASADLALSLDVIYHLVEDAVFDAYMHELFAGSHRFVAIYASDTARATDSPHVRHRNFTSWIERHAPDWRLVGHVPNRYPYDPAAPEETSFADFYFFEREAALGGLAGL
jgi:SAM-dependent methyltransferase